MEEGITKKSKDKRPLIDEDEEDGYAAMDGIVETFFAEGYPFGNNTGSDAKSIKFIITKIDSEMDKLRMISLPVWALPSLCPFINYHLELKKPERSAIYSVVRVLNCTPRTVTKKELKEFISKIDEKANYNFWKKLPDEFSRKYEEELDEAIENNKIAQLKICKIIEPAFKWTEFYELLRYFSGSFLLKLNKKKIARIYKLYKETPFAFCFWDLAYKELSTAKDEDGSYLFDPNEDRIYIEPNYVYHCRDMFEYDPSVVKCMSFSPKYPMWTITKLKYAMEDIGMKPPVSLHSLSEAMKLYYEFDLRIILFGNTIISLSKLKDKDVVISTPNETLHFLTHYNIMVHPVGDQGKKDLLTKPRIEQLELKITETLKKNIKNIGIIDCPFYNSYYVRSFTEWLQKNGSSERVNYKIASANATTAGFLATKTGLEVSSSDDFVAYLRRGNSKKRKKAEESYDIVAIDRTHKISLETLQFILSKTDDKKVFLFGDSSEYHLHSWRGFGSVFSQLVASPTFKNNIVRWNKWEKDHPITAVYRSLTNKEGILLSALNRVSLEKWRIFIEDIKQLDKDTKKSTEGYLIFCSTNADRNEIMPQICKRKQIPAEEYSEDKFFIGQKVHLMERDVWGNIEKAWRITDSGTENEIVGKNTINMTFNHYKLQIAGNTYYSIEHKIVHADVDIIREYAGQPANTVMFLVGKKTTRLELACAAKYAQKKFIIYIMPDVDFSSVSDILYTRVDSDLPYKLSCK